MFAQLSSLPPLEKGYLYSAIAYSTYAKTAIAHNYLTYERSLIQQFGDAVLSSLTHPTRLAIALIDMH
ncbi:MAG: hypothetical protein RMY29_012010 [Nostoc sp. CreGUA01]|nr:hypothetical protein [Nostoc sp. CreGUA01]